MTDRDPFYANLLEWVGGDYEIRSLEIDVRAEYVGYDDDDNPNPAVYWYEIKAHDVEIYGGEDGSGMLGVVFHGTGADLDEAAGHVLAVIKSQAIFNEKTRVAGIEWE